MPTPDSVSHATPGPKDHPNYPLREHYTGVVVIHGLGAIKRNTTLEEAVDTLAYWFNHKAGLSLRREGRGRVWVQAQLTDDPNPDAPPARALLSLVAPQEPIDTTAATGTGPDKPEEALSLEFREVWWAESFGVPSVGATIAWARVQAVEQATHLLLPIGRRLGPSQTARRAPAREVPQALTYHPTKAEAPSDRVASSSTLVLNEEPNEANDSDTTDGEHAHFTRTEKVLLTSALGIYGLVQYIWKAVQWLILTPLILLLLLVMGLLRVVVALIPPLQSSVIAGISAVLDTIMLHWIAEAQVYTLEYTRSAGIRERFQREVIDFLRDEACDRIVVIAHSMGTVIAYEGLTTIFDLPEFTGSTKPMTFICLAQALRRIWLMTADDPHRVHGVLPDHVRWLHFWARYDPVAAGPLTARTLPARDTWPDPEMLDPDAALASRLDRCENIDVVNTDSAFTDHTTYWQNLEQVVGPVACELVAGHPVLERVVAAHLATPDDVLLRRWKVAWWATVALALGFGIGLVLLVWDESTGWQRVGKTLATSLLHFLGDLLGVWQTASMPSSRTCRTLPMR